MLKRVFAVLLLAGLCFQVFAQQKTTAFSASLDSTWWFNIKNKKVNKAQDRSIEITPLEKQREEKMKKNKQPQRKVRHH